MRDEALKLALEALSPWMDTDADHTEQHAAYYAIKQALAAQPAPVQEPVATLFGSLPVYDTPPTAQRQWVGLTDEEIIDMYNEPRSDAEMIAFGREVEAKLKEKNHV